MQTIKTFLKIFTISLGMFFVCAGVVHAEVIHDFTSTITVSPDASITVQEKIVYDFEDAQRHGIFRTIPLQNAKGDNIKIDSITVTNAQGQVYSYTTIKENGSFKIKIGDPNVTITGIHEYNITYRVKRAIGYFDQYDEIYWNATGNEWPVVIEKAQVTVVLPQAIETVQQDCYVGIKGDTIPCATSASNVFGTSSALVPGQGLTIAVGFPKGIVEVLKESFFHKHKTVIIALGIILFPILLFVFLFLRWRKYGRDPKSSHVIVPQYDVPENLTPMEVGIIMNEKSRTKDISAEIIYLATKGYIKIRQTDTTILFFIHRKDYEFTLLKQPDTLQNVFDRMLVGKIFSKGSPVLLSSLQNNFYSKIPDLFGQVRNAVLVKNYYKNLPVENDFSFTQVISGPLTSLGGGLFIVIALYIFIPEVRSVTPILVVLTGISVIVSVALLFIFKKIMPAKTEKGVVAKDYILGLKQYLQIAEKDRLQFHNAPEKNPELFEKLLPYALVLGVENSWAQEFSGMYTTPPVWFEGQSGAFNALVLTHNLSNFTADASSSFASSPGGGSDGGGFSGSGGGGSSGGGGGGGGGGSW